MRGKLLIANPNCTTAIAAMALWPLHQRFTLRKVIMSTYQAASGAGAKGMTELEEGIRSHISGERIKANVFAHPLPFNVIRHIDTFQANGYTKEEMNVVWEAQKIFGSKEIFSGTMRFFDQLLRGAALNAVLIAERKLAEQDSSEL
jgi:aspartate-semialdehyde dehydrogenase